MDGDLEWLSSGSAAGLSLQRERAVTALTEARVADVREALERLNATWHLAKMHAYDFDEIFMHGGLCRLAPPLLVPFTPTRLSESRVSV